MKSWNSDSRRWQSLLTIIILAGLLSVAPPVYPNDYVRNFLDTSSATAGEATSDGGYVLAGASSNSGWVMRLDAAGEILWARLYGGITQIRAITHTGDGGFAFAGTNGGHVSLGQDFVVTRLSADGFVLWSKTYAGDFSLSSVGPLELPRSIVETFDAQGNATGFVVAGLTTSFGVTLSDFWVVRLDPSGNVIWEHTYGTAANREEWGTSVVQTSDGGFAVAGIFGRQGGVIRIDPTGGVLWTRVFSIGRVILESIIQTADGGFAVAGRIDAFDGRRFEAWVGKLTAGGDLDWQKAYGGPGHDGGTSIFLAGEPSIVQTPDGGYALGTSTLSFGAGSSDAWLLRLDAAGDLLFQRTYGSIGQETGVTFFPTSDGGYVLAGHSSSFSSGAVDALVVKVNAMGQVSACEEGDGPSCDLVGTGSPLVRSATVASGAMGLVAVPSNAIVSSFSPSVSTANFVVDQQCPLVDTDDDGLVDDEDNCPLHANPDQADFDGDGQGDVCDPDIDGDEVEDTADLCPLTTIPESVPTQWLNPAHWALVDGDDLFDTANGGNGGVSSYSTLETGGCSCEQIIDRLGLGNGHRLHGCSGGALDDWITSVVSASPHVHRADAEGNTTETVRASTLEENYPNPFNPSTEIRFTLLELSVVRLSVYDITGRQVAKLVDGAMKAGSHKVRFESAGLPSGIYLYRLDAGPYAETRRMILHR